MKIALHIDLQHPIILSVSLYINCCFDAMLCVASAHSTILNACSSKDCLETLIPLGISKMYLNQCTQKEF